jgi:hypothetical protein
MLGVGLSAYVGVWTASGTDLDTARKQMAFAVDATACATELGKEMLNDPSAWTGARAVFIEVFGCAGEVFVKAVNNRLWTVTTSVVGFVSGPVVGAFEGLVALGEISIDSLAQRATYDLTLAAVEDETPPASDPCNLVSSQLGPASSPAALVDGLCQEGWALVDTCVDCGGDTWVLARLDAGRWVIHTGFPNSLCADDARALGVPDPIIERVVWVPCQETPTSQTNATSSCGTVVSTIGSEVEVVIESGSVTCADALAIVDRYYNDPTLLHEGSSGSATIGDWLCASTSGAVLEQTGEAGQCTGPTGVLSLYDAR